MQKYNDCPTLWSHLPSMSPCIHFVGFATAIDECNMGQSDCGDADRASCTNTEVFFSCSCRETYTGDGRTCRCKCWCFLQWIFLPCLNWPKPHWFWKYCLLKQFAIFVNIYWFYVICMTNYMYVELYAIGQQFSLPCSGHLAPGARLGKLLNSF